MPRGRVRPAAGLSGRGHHRSGAVVTVVPRSARRTTDSERAPAMGRARRARRIAATAAYGGGGVAAGIGALGALGYGVLKAEARLARRIVGNPLRGRPRRQRPLRRRARRVPSSWSCSATPRGAGMGADDRYQTVGAIIATGVSALTGRPVRLTNTAVVGAESSDLELQLANALDQVPQPARRGHHGRRQRRDPPHRPRGGRPPPRVRRSSSCATPGAEVVVGTCPDLGTIQPIPQPLRLLGRRWSRDLAAAQTVAVVEAGGRTVSLGDLLGPEFAERPHEMFSHDRFHPSPAGYARVRRRPAAQRVCRARRLGGRRPRRSAARPPPRRGRRPRRPSRPSRPCATPAPRSAPTRDRRPEPRAARPLGVLLRRPRIPIPAAGRRPTAPAPADAATARRPGTGRGRPRRRAESPRAGHTRRTRGRHGIPSTAD